MNEYWGLFAQVGLWGWIISVVLFIHFSFPAVGVFVKREAGKWGGISLVFFAFWIAGMVLA